MLRRALVAVGVVGALLAVPVGAADAGLAYSSDATARCDTTTGTYVVTLTIENYSVEGFLSGSFEATDADSEPTGSGDLTFEPNPVPGGDGVITVAVFAVPGNTTAVDIDFEIFYPAGDFTAPGSASLELDGDCTPATTTTEPSGTTTSQPVGTSTSTAPPAAARTASPTFTG